MLDCALIGVCAVIRSNTVMGIDLFSGEATLNVFASPLKLGVQESKQEATKAVSRVKMAENLVNVRSSKSH